MGAEVKSPGERARGKQQEKRKKRKRQKKYNDGFFGQSKYRRDMPGMTQNQG